MSRNEPRKSDKEERRRRTARKPGSYIKDLRQWVSVVNGAVKEATGKPVSIHASEFLHNVATSLRDRAEGRKPTPAVHAPYQVLGVKQEDDQEKVKKVYLALVKLYHEAGPMANEDKWKEVNVAYSMICEQKGWDK